MRAESKKQANHWKHKKTLMTKEIYILLLQLIGLNGDANFLDQMQSKLSKTKELGITFNSHFKIALTIIL